MRIVGQRAPVRHGCVGLCTFGILRKGWRLLGFAPGPFTALRLLAPPPLCLRVPPQFFGAASSHGAGGLLGELALPGLFLEALLLLFLAFLGLLLLADARLLFSSEAFLFEVLLLVAAPVFAGAGGLLGEFSFPDRFLRQLFFATLFLFRAALFYGAGGLVGELPLPGFFLASPLLLLLPFFRLLFFAPAGGSLGAEAFLVESLFLFGAALFFGAGGFLAQLPLLGFFLAPPLLFLLALLFFAPAGRPLGAEFLFEALFLFCATLFCGAGGFLGELALPGFFLSPPLLVLLPLLCLLFLAAAGLSCSTSTFPFGRFARCALPKRLAIALAGRRLDVAQCPHDREPNDVCDRCRISGRIRRLVRDRCRNRLHTEGFLEGDRSFCRLAVGEG